MKTIAINFFFQIFSRSRSSSSSTTTSISRPTSTKPTKENIQNNLEADQNQNPSKKSRLNSDTDSSRLTEKSGDNKEMSSSNNPTINAEPIEQRWEDTAGMYTHKKFKKMASSAKIPIASTSGTSSAVSEKEQAESSISKVIPTTSSSVVSDRIPEKTREIPSRNNSVASIEQLPSSTLSFPSASLGGAAATLKHGVMSLIENPSVANFASLAAPPLMPQQQLVSQHQHVPIQQLISHHSSASTANSHLPSRQVVSASLSSKVCIH